MSKETILVVDDEPIVREFCIRLLRMKEYKVSAAENGRVALSMLEKQQYDLVLTDLQMPEMGGLDLLREIRAHYTDIDVVIFTASATVETARAALTSGPPSPAPRPADTTPRRMRATGARAATVSC